MSRAGPVAAVGLRPARDDDAELLFAVYASTRAEELALVDWPGEAKERFLLQQFAAQSEHYRRYYEGMSSQIVLVDGVPAGRLLVARWPTEIRVVDIALLPEFRGRRVGASLLGEVIDEAERSGKRVTVHVEQFNPALRLYDRLGFRRAGETGVYLFLERLPTARAGEPPCESSPS